MINLFSACCSQVGVCGRAETGEPPKPRTRAERRRPPRLLVHVDADFTQNRFKALSEVLAENAVKNRVRGGVDVRDDHDKHSKRPAVVEMSCVERVVKQQHLIGRIAHKIHHHAHYQHLHNALACLNCFRSPFFRESVFVEHCLSPVKLFGTQEQVPGDNGVQRHLYCERDDVEQQEFDVFEDHVEEIVVDGEGYDAIHSLHRRVARRHLVVEQRRNPAKSGKRPHAGHHTGNSPPVAQDVCPDGVDYSDESEMKINFLVAGW